MLEKTLPSQVGGIRSNVKMTRKAWLGSLFLFATLATTACGNSAAPATTKPAAPGIAVAVSPAQRGAIEQTFTFTGDVKAVSEVNVAPKESGRIVRMPVDVGAKVQAGDVIAELDHVSLDLNVRQAQAGLLTAQAKLASVQAGPRDEVVAQAQLAVDTAQSRLQAMRDGAKPSAIAQAQAQVVQAQARLDSLRNPRPEVVAQAKLNVDLAQQKLATVQAGGRPEAIAQAQGNLNAAQARLQALKNGMRPEDRVAFELTVAQAKNALYSAQILRDGACNPSNPHYQCDAANAQVNAAQTAVDQAVANLKAKVAQPSQTDVQQAQAAVDQAQAALDAAKNPYTAQDLAQAQDGVRQAEQQLALAQAPASAQDIAGAQAQVTQAIAALDLVRQPYTQEDIHQAENAVAVAAQQLELAKKPYTAQDIQEAQAGVVSAQVTVDRALQAVKDTTVIAPVTGVVTQKSLTEGALASPATSVVTIASNGVKVQIPVEENQVVVIRVGEGANITGSALIKQGIDGRVSNIAPSGDSHNRSFSVDVLPGSGETLLPGMFVQVTIKAQEHQNAIKVPKNAVVQRASKPFVFVVRDNVARQVPVTLGLENDRQVEIVNGLTVDDNVVIQGQQNLNDNDRVSVASAQAPTTSPEAALPTNGQ